MQSINKYLSYEQQMENLKNRKLIFPDDESRNIFLEYLKEYNYSNFISGLKNKKMFDENGNYLQSFTSNNLRYLFDIDRNISAIIWRYFKGLELHFNTSLIRVLAEVIQEKTNTPYLCCLTEKDFDDIFNQLKDTNFFEVNLTVKKRLFIEEFYKNYDTVSVFDEIASNNMDSEHDEIIKKIDSSWIVNKWNTKDKKKRKWVYIQIFTLCSSFTFSQTNKLYNAMNISLKNKFIYEFTKNLKKNSKIKMTYEDMRDLLWILSKFRNALAHHGCMIKYNISLNSKSKIFNFFEIEKSDENYTTLYLSDVIKIIEKVRGLQCGNIINEICDGIKNKFKNRKKRDDISPILYEIIEDETKFKLPDEIKDIK